jgi:acetyl esterase/lipase
MDARANYLKACAANGLAPQAVADVRTLDYSVTGGTASLRVYRAAGTPAHLVTPVVVFIHGGGWVIGDLHFTRAGLARMPTATAGTRDGLRHLGL